MGAVVTHLRERAEEAAQQAERLRKMVALADELGEEGLAELAALIAPGETNGNGNGTVDTATATPATPKGREAVRIIVARRPGIWTLQDLRAEMEREGWFTSRAGLEAAVKRLCTVNREGQRIGAGRYVFPANHGEEDAIESLPSGVAMITPS